MSGCASATVFSRSRSPLESGLRRCVFFRVVGPRLLPREAEAFDDVAHAGRAVVDIEAVLGQRAQVVERVSREAVLLRIRTCDDDRGELLLLLRVEFARTARARAIVEAVEPFRVVALDRIAERLPAPCRQPAPPP